MNIKLRLKNPTWWFQIIATIVLTMLAGIGMNWEQMTTWSAIGDAIIMAIQNPVVVVAVLMAIFNSMTDPTTRGIKDSERALGYTEPM